MCCLYILGRRVVNLLPSFKGMLCITVQENKCPAHFRTAGKEPLPLLHSCNAGCVHIPSNMACSAMFFFPTVPQFLKIKLTNKFLHAVLCMRRCVLDTQRHQWILHG